MEIKELVKVYEKQLESAQNELNSVLDTVLLKDQRLLEDIFAVVEAVQESQMSFLKIDNIEETYKETQYVINLAENIHKFYSNLIQEKSESPEDQFKTYQKNLKTLETFPMLQSPLIAELKQILNTQKSDLILTLNHKILKEFAKNTQHFEIFQEFWETKKLLQSFGHWEELKCYTKISGFFKDHPNGRFKVKTLIGKSLLKVRKVKSEKFEEKLEELQRFFEFFRAAFQESDQLRSDFLPIIEETIKIQAEKCVRDDLLKSSTLSLVKPFEVSLSSYGFSLNLQALIVNCQDFLLTSWKHSFLSSARSLLLSPYTNLELLSSCTVSSNCKSFTLLLLQIFSMPQSTEYEKVFILTALKELLILFQALRSQNLSLDIRSLTLFISDTEYLLTQLRTFSSFQSNYPEALSYLLDFSDISAILSSELQPFYSTLMDLSQKEVIKKCEPLDFCQFDENFLQQESIILRIVLFIRKSEIKTFLPFEIHCKLLGEVIDCLINETVTRVLVLKNIYIKDFQLIKHFFDKIFEVRDIFEGQNPTKFCAQWDKLEALLEIIEGRLVDIVAAYQRNRYNSLFTLKQLRRLIKALFEDNPKRANALKLLT